MCLKTDAYQQHLLFAHDYHVFHALGHGSQNQVAIKKSHELNAPPHFDLCKVYPLTTSSNACPFSFFPFEVPLEMLLLEIVML